MKKSQSDDWIKSQAKELAGRGMSVDYLSKVLRKDVGDAAADRFVNVMGGIPTASRKSKKKSGLLGKLFGS